MIVRLLTEISFAFQGRGANSLKLRSRDYGGICQFICLLGMAFLVGCGGSDEVVTKPANEASSFINPEDSLVEIRRSIIRRQYDVAKRRISNHLLVSPKDTKVLELAGDLHAQLGEVRESVEFFRQAIEYQTKPKMTLIDKLGQQWMTLGRPFESLAVLDHAIDLYPNDASARQRLVGLQVSLGLEQQAFEHLRWLVQRQQGQLNFLVILSDLTRPQTVEASCRYALDQKTGDLRPCYSLARIPAYHGRWQEVYRELEPLMLKDPGFAMGSALWGRALVELERYDDLKAWASNLPEGIEDCVDYWMAMGAYAETLGQFSRAVGAFQRVLLINPSHPEALSRLALTLGRLGKKEQAQRVAARSAEVSRLRTHVDSLISWKNNSQQSALKIATSLDKLGRLWEATAWLAAAYPMTQNIDREIKPAFESMRSRLNAQTPWQTVDQLVVSKQGLFPIGEFDWAKRDSIETTQQSSGLTTQLRFIDEASERNLVHQCEIAISSDDESGLSIYQSGAGGAGVIDYDLDGWPDLYLTAMDGTPNLMDSMPNRLYRNVAGLFSDQTDDAKVGDRGFSQGIAVGDYDADGFPDILVANIGRNQLYRNNGDGTFAEVSDGVGLSGVQWTTSVAMADFDGDGNCDIFELGYCAGSDVLSRKCVEKEIDAPRSCSPLAFPAQPDRVWRSNGAGDLIDVTREWLGEHESGRGMGIVVGQFDESPGLDLYVANDMTANHLWLASEKSNRFLFSEQATLRGLALNQRSVAQASMGIAVGDADQDSDIDFFVTHFSADYNTYYEQVDKGLWTDRSDVADLANPSQRMLAYGAQWLDVNNDGDLELLVANGDIDDFTHKDRLYRQPFQVFDREPAGRWQLLQSESLGAYFTKPHLARSVVGADIDRDHRVDLVVTHLFEPVAVLRNNSQDTGNSVRLIFKGTRCHRDAIGVEVHYQIGDQSFTKQLYAGDGYHCSSERIMSIGVGAAERLEGVLIHWPDGGRETIGDLETGSDYMIVQGLNEPFGMSIVEESRPPATHLP